MHSQEAEERHVLAAFEASFVGRFLDIGAWHPKTFSNTRALWERGWSGVMIEPSPVPLLNLMAAYGDDPRVTLVAGAIGFDSHCHPMRISDDGLSSREDSDGGRGNIEKWNALAKWRGTLWLPMITPEELWTQFGFFDFINVDVEGMSADLFLHWLEINMFPRCYCVEHDGRVPELEKTAAARGYRMTYSNGTNAVFVK